MLKFILPLLFLLPLAPKKKEMLLVRGGSFRMQNKVNVTINSFYLGKYELTMEEYDAFCQATGRPLPNDKGWGRGNRPAIHVSWYDAIEYCNWRSEQEQFQPCYTIDKSKSTADTMIWSVRCDWSANGYRLPTEAEWEYAALGGRKSKGKLYAGHDDQVQVAWYDLNSDHKTHEIGMKRRNELGFYDLSGNVWEWCWHWFEEESQTNERVLRGGSWRTNAFNVKVLTRIVNAPDSREDEYGFRLARSVK